jgi:hypothetical protein
MTPHLQKPRTYFRLQTPLRGVFGSSKSRLLLPLPQGERTLTAHPFLNLQCHGAWVFTFISRNSTGGAYSEHSHIFAKKDSPQNDDGYGGHQLSHRDWWTFALSLMTPHPGSSPGQALQKPGTYFRLRTPLRRVLVSSKSRFSAYALRASARLVLCGRAVAKRRRLLPPPQGGRALTATLRLIFGDYPTARSARAVLRCRSFSRQMNWMLRM